jgi:hypothetical protein
MDVEVFSPGPASTDLPPAAASGESLEDESGDETSQLLVKIDRATLSSLPSATEFPKSQQNSRRFTVSLPIGPSLHDFCHRRRRRRQRSCPDPTYNPAAESRARIEELETELIVRIPLHVRDSSTETEGESVEDGDESTTIMELLASKLDDRTGREGRRVPEIIRLESHCPDSEERAEIDPPPNSDLEEVAEYLTLPSVCSSEDLSCCLHELSDLCRESRDSGREEAAGPSFEVGGEIELGVHSLESNSSTEPTGMELLNLDSQRQQTTPPSPHHHSTPKSKTVVPPTVYCEDLMSEIKGKLSGRAKWRVEYMMCNKGVRGARDPRYRLQRYSLGDQTLFELSRIHFL